MAEPPAQPSPERLIAEAVARYFDAHDSSRPSVDRLVEDLLPGASSDHRAGIRESLIGALSAAGRARIANSRASNDPAPDESNELPEIPGYDLIEEIGRGGMGVVYEGYQRSTGRRVAVKFMRGVGRSLSLRFEREIDLLARLSHPGIVSVLDSGSHASRWYYVMEHVDGLPLDEHIKPGDADPRVALARLADVADIVNEAHQRGVLHRDLKPANILVERDGRVRLLDFGLAKAIDPESGAHAELTISDAGRPMGTLAYMPPEQAAGGSNGISVRSDVYALGVIGYYLLTGRHPIDVDGKLMEVIHRIQTASPPRPSSIRAKLGADVDAIIGMAMAKLAQDRYATAADLAADIRRWLAGRPILARPVSPAVRAWRWIGRNRVLSGVVTGCAVALIAMATIAVRRIIQERNRANELLLETFSQFRQVDGMEDLARQRITAAQRLYGEGSRFHAIAVIQLGLLLENQQRNVEAEVYMRQGLALIRALRPPESDDVCIACLHHGRLLVWVGKHEEGEPLLKEAAAIAAKFGDVAELTRAQAIFFTGLSHTLRGQYAEAEPYLRQAHEWWAADPITRDNGWYAGCVRTYADCLFRLQRFDEAERMMLDALATEERAGFPDVSRRLRLIDALGSFYYAVGRKEEGDALAETFRGIVQSTGATTNQKATLPEFQDQ